MSRSLNLFEESPDCLAIFSSSVSLLTRRAVAKKCRRTMAQRWNDVVISVAITHPPVSFTVVMDGAGGQKMIKYRTVARFILM